MLLKPEVNRSSDDVAELHLPAFGENAEFNVGIVGVRHVIAFLRKRAQWRTNMAKQSRRRIGYTMAEFAPTLFLALLIIALPLLGLGTMALRYVFLVNAARLAVQAASRTESFLNDSSPTQLSAVHTASNVASAPIPTETLESNQTRLSTVKSRKIDGSARKISLHKHAAPGCS